jgi:hypothetical protein
VARVKPAGPTKPNTDLAAELKARVGATARVVADLIRFAPVFAYFYIYWKPKELLRRWRRVGALSFLSVSLLLLWLEVLVEVTKHKLIAAVVPHSVAAQWTVLLLFSAAVIVVLLHHGHERRHQHSEFLLAERVWEFMMTRDGSSVDASIRRATELFYDVFRRFGIKHVSVALPEGNELVIREQHVHPPEPSGSYYARLPLDDGVAGLVYKDAQPRYLPRLFFPFGKRGVFFPHAMVFEIRKGANHRIDVVRPKLDLEAFKPFGDPPFAFSSFVSVPLKPVGKRECIGVLIFDFDRTDPLTRMDIKMAVFLGLLLSDELDRLTRAKAAAGTA